MGSSVWDIKPWKHKRVGAKRKKGNALVIKTEQSIIRFRYQKAGSRGTLSSIWDICAIAKITAYFIIYLRGKGRKKDLDGDRDR